jgi:peptide/nickel transport system substrate-binding protein
MEGASSTAAADASGTIRGGQRMKLRMPAFALCLAFLVLVSACSSDDEGGGEATAGGTLIVARTADIDKLDPHVATAFGTFQTLGLVFDTLTDLDEQLVPEPGLAETFEYSDDGTSLTFQLRDGLTFHDGTDLTSSDVKASIERILNEKTAAVARTNFLSIETVETPDPRTVVLRLSRPDASLTSAFATVNAAIVPEEAVAKDTLAKKPIGSGPFEFDDWKQGESVTLTANEDYWGEGPNVDQVDFRVVPEESSILSGTQAGQFDLGLLTDPQVAVQVEAAGLELDKTPSLAYHTLMLNGNQPPLDQLEVRQAIACAIDRSRVVEAAALGEGEVTGPFTSPAYEFEPTGGLPCDPPDLEAARRLLEDAGEQDGFTLETIVMTDGYATAVDEGQSLKSQLAEIGIDLRTTSLETSVYVERWLAADFDAAVALNGGLADPYLMYARYFTSDGNLNSVAGYSSSELDRLLERGRAETDLEERQAIFEEFSTELVEASPWVWVFNGYDYRLVGENVRGYEPDPSGALDMIADVSLAR